MTRTFKFNVTTYLLVEADDKAEAQRRANEIVNKLHASAPVGARVGMARPAR